MTGKSIKIASIAIIATALSFSGCQSSTSSWRTPSWFPHREKAFAYAAPVDTPQLASNVVATQNSQGTATPLPPRDPYAAGADATIAESTQSSAAPGSPDSGRRSSSTCTSGCCSR